jgi:hypothetical protein
VQPGTVACFQPMRRGYPVNEILKDFAVMRPGVLVVLALPVDDRFLGLTLVDVRAQVKT